MAGHDYTQPKRMQKLRERKKQSGLKEVREFVPPDLAHVLKRIAAEMRNPDTAERYRQRLPISESED